jgi:microcystin-dependent protein
MKINLSKIKVSMGATAVVMAQMVAAPATAQASPFLGQLTDMGFNFCPRGWAAAAGQILPINSNQALFSLLGTMYGGDGRTSFALPDLRGRRPVGAGSGPGLGTIQMGQRSGIESFSMFETNLPSHNHIVNSTNETANKNGPGTDFLSVPTLPDLDIYHEGPSSPASARQMDPGMIAHTGGQQAINKTSPSLGMNWCIAMEGLFPSRN